MLEKTFLDPISYGIDTSRLSKEERVEYKTLFLQKKREKTVGYLALLFNVNPSTILIAEGIDILRANMGRYEGEAHIGPTRIRFVSQAYYKSSSEVYTHVVAKELEKA